MNRSKEELLKRLSDQVFEMEDDTIAITAQEYLEAGFAPLDGITHGLVDGMNRAGEMYEQEEYFITDLLLCSDAMYNGLDVLKPHLPQEKRADEVTFRAVIGVVEGDTHDIGKNLVRIMMETAGFEMHDLGRDVPLDRFVEKAEELDADLIVLSTLMTTTMPAMQRVVELLKESDRYGRTKVMIGGGPINQAYADRIAAHGYSANAVEAVKLGKTLCGIPL